MCSLTIQCAQTHTEQDRCMYRNIKNVCACARVRVRVCVSACTVTKSIAWNKPRVKVR